MRILPTVTYAAIVIALVFPAAGIVILALVELLGERIK